MTANAARITCIGAITADTTLTLKSRAISGTSNPATRSCSIGGVAHNVARNLVQLGVAARLATVVGDDAEGRSLLQAAKAHGIDVSSSALLPSRASGSYTALVGPDGELQIGASDIDICDAMDANFLRAAFGSLHADEPVFADTNLPVDTLRTLLGICTRDDIVLYVDAVSVAKAARLPHALSGIDTLFANCDEAAVLSGMSADADGETLAQAILARGPQTVVVTQGEAGLCWAGSAGRGRLPALAARVRDVTGAGDALVAACIAGRQQQRSLDASLRMGLCAAAHVVEVSGAFSDRLSVAAIENRCGEAKDARVAP